MNLNFKKYKFKEIHMTAVIFNQKRKGSSVYTWLDETLSENLKKFKKSFIGFTDRQKNLFFYL